MSTNEAPEDFSPAGATTPTVALVTLPVSPVAPKLNKSDEARGVADTPPPAAVPPPSGQRDRPCGFVTAPPAFLSPQLVMAPLYWAGWQNQTFFNPILPQLYRSPFFSPVQSFGSRHPSAWGFVGINGSTPSPMLPLGSTGFLSNPLTISNNANFPICQRNGPLAHRTSLGPSFWDNFAPTHQQRENNVVIVEMDNCKKPQSTNPSAVNDKSASSLTPPTPHFDWSATARKSGAKNVTHKPADRKRARDGEFYAWLQREFKLNSRGQSNDDEESVRSPKSRRQAAVAADVKRRRGVASAVEARDASQDDADCTDTLNRAESADDDSWEPTNAFRLYSPESDKFDEFEYGAREEVVATSEDAAAKRKGRRIRRYIFQYLQIGDFIVSKPVENTSSRLTFLLDFCQMIYQFEVVRPITDESTKTTYDVILVVSVVVPLNSVTSLEFDKHQITVEVSDTPLLITRMKSGQPNGSLFRQMKLGQSTMDVTGGYLESSRVHTILLLRNNGCHIRDFLLLCMPELSKVIKMSNSMDGEYDISIEKCQEINGRRDEHFMMGSPNFFHQNSDDEEEGVIVD